VIVYHYFGVLGGYVGVDIFFVISGYLISLQIMTALESQSFSLTDFYAKRIRRILPALAVVICTCLAFAWFFLFPTDFVLLGKHSAAGILNVSNLVLWSESGYFDTSSTRKPFLHFWSLGIEEQFYLVWPLLLIVFFKFKKHRLTCLITLTIASFILNVIATQTDRTLAFYMPVTRFWELSSGGLLAYYVVQRSAKAHGEFTNNTLINPKALPVIGFLLIALATALLDHKSAFPGFWALLPVIGTCLMIAPIQHAPDALRFLRSKPALFIGRISFSLYLWHWPILLLSQSADLKSRGAKFIALLSCFVLAWLTYRFVEQPFRMIKVTRANAKKFIWTGVLVTLVIALAGILIATRTIKRSWDETLISNTYEVPIIGCGAFADLGREFNPSIFDRCDKIQFPANGTVMMLGDSHSQALYQGLKPYLDDQKINLIAYPILECTPLSLNDKRPRCVDYNTWIQSQIQRIKPELVILFAHHLFRTKDPYYGESLPYPDYLWKAATKLKSEGIKNVWIIGDIPNWQVSLPHAMNFNFLRHDQPVPERTYAYVVRDSLAMDTTLRAADNRQGVQFISLKDALCNEQGCLTKVGTDFPNDLIVMDYGHLTKNGAAYISEKILGKKILSVLRASER
jgi:peptidoglycan/LPS O-acetylase OafA/YrhL